MKSSKQEFLQKGWESAGFIGEGLEIIVKENEHGSMLYRTLFEGNSTGMYPESIDKDIVKLIYKYISK